MKLKLRNGTIVEYERESGNHIFATDEGVGIGPRISIYIPKEYVKLTLKDSAPSINDWYNKNNGKK
jgi:hypothetical protein